MRIGRHHHDQDDEQLEREAPVWEATKPSWGVVSIDAPKAIDLRTPERAA